jgi:ribosomal protein S3AE
MDFISLKAQWGKENAILTSKIFHIRRMKIPKLEVLQEPSPKSGQRSDGATENYLRE